MSKNPDYNRATNAAYETLTKYAGDYPIIDIYGLLSSFPNVEIYTYSEMAKRFGLSFYDFCSNFSSSNHGFTIRRDKNGRTSYIVLYNERKDATTIKFTLAHETGHIVMNHQEDGEIEDKEANCFARNILCPVPVINNFDLQTYSDYMECFRISEPFAIAASGNYSSDKYYISQENYNKIDELSYFNITGYSPYEVYL